MLYHISPKTAKMHVQIETGSNKNKMRDVNDDEIIYRACRIL